MGLKRKMFVLHNELLVSMICLLSELPPSRGVPYFNDDLPEDAKLVSVDWDIARKCFLVSIEHDNFEEIPEGQELPVISSRVFQFCLDDRYAR